MATWSRCSRWTEAPRPLPPNALWPIFTRISAVPGVTPWRSCDRLPCRRNPAGQPGRAYAVRGLLNECCRGEVGQPSPFGAEPGRLLQLQCEGECWCKPAHAVADGWDGHGRGPTPCPFEDRSYDEASTRLLVTSRQARALGSAQQLARVPCSCAPTSCLTACLGAGRSTRSPILSQLSGSCARGSRRDRRAGYCCRAVLGAGRTGLATAAARRFLEMQPDGTVFHGRSSAVCDELAGKSGIPLAQWLAGVDLLIVDDLDFGFQLEVDGDRGPARLAESLSQRVGSGRCALLTAHMPLLALFDGNSTRWCTMYSPGEDALR